MGELKSETVQNMNSYPRLKRLFLLSLLFVDKCFSQTTTQPIQKDGCPLFLVHGGSRLKRAEPSAHPTEWSICKRERGEDACLYRAADASKEEEGGQTYCTSIGPSQDST